jgi:O-antigen/teichoic acid export membrane protein
MAAESSEAAGPPTTGVDKREPARAPWVRLAGGPLRRATITSMAMGVAGQLMLFVSGPLIARILGPADRGRLAALAAWVGVLIVISTAGVPTALTYALSRERGAFPTAAVKAVRIAAWQCLLAGAVVAGYVAFSGAARFLHPVVAVATPILIVPGTIAAQYALALLQADAGMRRFNLLRLVPAFTYALTACALWFAEAGTLSLVVLGWALSQVATGALGVALVVSSAKGVEDHSRPEIPGNRVLYTFGLKGLLGTVSPLEGLRVDIMIASMILPSSAIGLYAVACSFVNLPRFLAQSAGMVLFPAAARGETDSERAIWWTALRLVLMIGGVVAASILLVPVMMRVLFGPEFQASTRLAQVLLVGALASSARLLIAEALRGFGRPSAGSFAEISMYPWLVVFGVWLIPKYGVLGLAWSVSVAQMVSLGVVLVVVARRALDARARRHERWQGEKE